MLATLGKDRAFGSLARAEAVQLVGFHVSSLRARHFRNHETVDLTLDHGTTVLHGPTGAGKTNLLEAVHFACTGKSCRSVRDRDLIRFGERAAHAGVLVGGTEQSRTFETSIEVGRGKLMKVDGVPADRAPAGAERPHLCVFMPDRLELVRGPARIRREHFDTLLATLWPARRATRLSYVRALAQRNALLARVRAGLSTPGTSSGWDHELARHGFELMKDRAALLEAIAPIFASRAAELGLEGKAALVYRPRSGAAGPAELESELAERFSSDVERGFSGHGPHRDDFRFELDGRELRRFGSQGQQRLALLALLLAERDTLASLRGRAPILLLDDVLSELDPLRRQRLLETLDAGGQALITTAEPEPAWMAKGAVTAVRVEAGVVVTGSASGGA